MSAPRPAVSRGDDLDRARGLMLGVTLGAALWALLLLAASIAEASGAIYLMAPPVSDPLGPNPKVVVSAPLRDWTLEDTFARVEDCRETVTIFRSEAGRSLNTHRKQLNDLRTTPEGRAVAGSDPTLVDFIKGLIAGAKAERDRMDAARCIASDDPRLGR